uniref:Cytochrome b5 n=1 Tax=Timema tahoe TaxID=61484 RepID=A0A7R9FGL4_9NEOP|nr:unnamed protein product [Timema tahoe]
MRTVELGQEVEGKGVSHLSDQALLETESKRAKDASLNKKHNSSVPLLHLVKLLLRNGALLTQSRLQAVHGGGALTQETREKAERSPSLNLLLKFQRLLIAQIYSHSDKIKTWNSQQATNRGSEEYCLTLMEESVANYSSLTILDCVRGPAQDVLGAETLITKYIYLLSSHVSEILPSAAELAAVSSKHFSYVASVLRGDVIDVLLPELLLSLILLQLEAPLLLHHVNWVPLLSPLLDTLDKFNRLAPGGDKDDAEDMAWPGIIAPQHSVSNQKTPEDAPMIRKADLENHNRDGGLWIVINRKVYDVQDFRAQAPCSSELLQRYAGRDATQPFHLAAHSPAAREMMQGFFVGHYTEPEQEITQVMDAHSITSPLMDVERNLAFLLGLHAHWLGQSTPLQPAEEGEARRWLNAVFLQGGLQVLQPANPYEEEKGEARSTSSTAGTTPTDPANTPKLEGLHRLALDRATPFLQALADNRSTDSYVQCYLSLVERHCKQHHLMIPGDFSQEHPVQEVGRLLTAVLIKHHGLGALVLALIEQGTVILYPLIASPRYGGYQLMWLHFVNIECGAVPVKLPKPLMDIVRTVHQSKWNLIRMRQELSRSYKEVCTPVMDKCRCANITLMPLALSSASLKPILWDGGWEGERRGVASQLTKVSFRANKNSWITETIDGASYTTGGDLNSTLLRLVVRFLLYEVRSSTSPEVQALQHLQLLHTEPRWRKIVKGLIADRRLRKHSPPPAKPEDILNASIQSQSAEGKSKEVEEEEFCAKEEKKYEGSGDAEEPWSTVPNLMVHAAGQLFSAPVCDNPEKQQQQPPPPVVYSPEAMKVTNAIVEFVLQEEGADVDTLRKVLYCQVQRARIRIQGLEMISGLLQKEYLIGSVKYSLMNGWLGLAHKKQVLTGQTVRLAPGRLMTGRSRFESRLGPLFTKWAISCAPREDSVYCLNNVQLANPYQKVEVLLAQSRVTSWAVDALREHVLLAHHHPAHSHKLRGKGSLNQGTYSWLRKIPWARFLLAILGMLTGSPHAIEVSLIVNSGVLGLVQTLLRQIGPDTPPCAEATKEVYSIYEDSLQKTSAPSVILSGPELATMMKIGTRVVRGVDWKWGDQFQTQPCRVKCEREDSPLVLHPTGWPAPGRGQGDRRPRGRRASVTLMRTLAICSGIEGDHIQASAIRIISSLLREIIQLANKHSDCSSPAQLLAVNHHAQWATLGFVRAIAYSPALCRALSTPAWVHLLLSMVGGQDSDIAIRLPKQVLSLRLLRAVLPSWEVDPSERLGLLEKLFHLLGYTALFCPTDTPLPVSRVSLTASQSSSVAEECIALLRSLHGLPGWNQALNHILATKLVVAGDLLTEGSLFHIQVNECEVDQSMAIQSSVNAALSVLGGVDSRVRIGGLVAAEGLGQGEGVEKVSALPHPFYPSAGTVCQVSQHCKLVVQLHDTGEVKKLALGAVVPLPTAHFNLDKMLMTENMLDTWATLVSLITHEYSDRRQPSCVPGTCLPGTVLSRKETNIYF